jgi:hypothetical protein
MSAFRIRAFDAARRKLDDRIDVLVKDLTSGEVVAHERDQKGTTTIRVEALKPGRIYAVQVFPVRHRPVGAVQRAPEDGQPAANIHVFCPVHAARVSDVTFPAWADLPPELRDALERSTLEADAAGPAVIGSGQPLYDSLADVPKAGLLNLFTKMQQTVTGGRTMWSFVTDVYRIRGDRIFANVTIDFRDHIKSSVASGDFAPVDGSLHTPPPGFQAADSFKHQLFQAGVLQLTFFSSIDQPLRFRVDADIDDAGGLGHVFQVLRNWITQGDTNPYDIHQILTYHQQLAPGYELVT